MDELVSIVILNYNNNYATLDCLKSICMQLYKNFEVIIVDNGSDKNKYHNLKEDLKKFKKNFNIKLIRIEKNLFFAAGMNKGIKASIGNYICLLCNDIIVEPDFIGRFVNFLEKNNNVGIASPKIKVYGNKNYIWYAGSEVSFKNPYLTKIRGMWENDPHNQKYNNISTTGFAAGTVLFLKREVIAKIGLLDEIFFMYHEDLDWNFRAKNVGFKIYYLPITIVYHKVLYLDINFYTGFFLIRNSQIFVWKHSNLKNLIIFYFQFSFFNLRLIINNFKKKKNSNIYFQFKSIWQGFRIGVRKRTNRTCRRYLLKDYYFIKRNENYRKSL